jgi:hypothetical protein
MESSSNCVLNYVLNKYCPIAVIGVLLFLNMGFIMWEPYVIMGLVWFVSSFSFKVGYSVAICEEKGLLDKDD